ncbi:MAG TPA: AI-2E family transporter [Jatrophihabitans sp.]|jgi:predicted PurR-regulated permease PerM|uniref:AI-2E family transporter n=1 Tax=Jatrophihabitans sp. TaxID=1932789 RepID=UPI002E005B03|nr:AI-2E family transporter [Jatrophihabitans sp.]
MPEADDDRDERSSDEAFGRPGARLDRQAPYFRGFFFTLGVLTALVLGSAVQDAASALTLVLIATVLAVGLDPVVAFLVRRGLSRSLAVTAVAVGALVFVAVLVITIGGVLRTQVVTFIDDAPRLLDDLRRNRTVAQLDRKFHIISTVEDKIKNPGFAQSTFDTVFQAGLTAANAIVNTVVVFILTVYFLSALPQLKRAGYSLAPASRRARIGKLGDEILRRVGGFVIGAVLVALMAGSVTLVFTLSVGLGAYALPLAVLVALLDLVPLVGAILGASIVCLVGFATSLPVGITCVIFYVVYELIEGYVVYPRVMRATVDVPEYVTIVAVLVGGAVAGIVGALLALPTAAAVLLLVREVWVRRQDAV